MWCYKRRWMLALTLVMGVLLLWSLVWKPVSDWRELEANRYQNARALVDWMRANESRARSAAQGGPSGTSERSLLPVITRAAEAQGLKLTRLQPEGNGAVSVVLQAQPFNDVLRWLAQLQENNGVSVLRVSIDAEGRPGLVNGQLRLQ